LNLNYNNIKYDILFELLISFINLIIY